MAKAMLNTAPVLRYPHGRGVACGRPMQWYSSPNAAITAGSYKLRPSNTSALTSLWKHDPP